MCTYEDGFTNYACNYLAPDWISRNKIPPEKIWHIVHSVNGIDQLKQVLQLSKARNAGHVSILIPLWRLFSFSLRFVSPSFHFISLSRFFIFHLFSFHFVTVQIYLLRQSKFPTRTVSSLMYPSGRPTQSNCKICMCLLYSTAYLFRIRIYK